MRTVVERQAGWEDKAWDSLPETRRQLLLENGFTKETFLRDADGNSLASNTFSYHSIAMFEAQRIAGTTMREKLFEKDYHEGWADWTRRFTDTIKVDFAGNPYTTYFAVGAIPAMGAGLMLSSGSIGASTAIGTRMAYTALDGLAYGLSEGYALSTAGQINNIRSGFATEINWRHTTQTMLTYGALGAIAGGTLSGGVSALGPAARGAARISNKAASLADTIAAEGYFGTATAQRALNRMAERQATLAEIEGASILANIQNLTITVLR